MKSRKSQSLDAFLYIHGTENIPRWGSDDEWGRGDVHTIPRLAEASSILGQPIFFKWKQGIPKSSNSVFSMNFGNKSNEDWSLKLWMQFMQLRKEAWKNILNFNRVWIHDLAIPVRCSNQMSYAATDVGSRSIVG